MIDTPRVRKQTRQFSTLRGEGGDLSELESDEEYPPANSRQSRTSRRSERHTGGGYGRTDCFRVEKHLLVYGYACHSDVKRLPAYEFLPFDNPINFIFQLGPLARHFISCQMQAQA